MLLVSVDASVHVVWNNIYKPGNKFPSSSALYRLNKGYFLQGEVSYKKKTVGRYNFFPNYEVRGSYGALYLTTINGFYGNSLEQNELQATTPY